jgi:hypothetical protein
MGETPEAQFLWRERPRGQEGPREQGFRPELTAWGRQGTPLRIGEQVVEAPDEGP